MISGVQSQTFSQHNGINFEILTKDTSFVSFSKLSVSLSNEIFQDVQSLIDSPWLRPNAEHQTDVGKVSLTISHASETSWNSWSRIEHARTENITAQHKPSVLSFLDTLNLADRWLDIPIIN